MRSIFRTGAVTVAIFLPFCAFAAQEQSQVIDSEDIADALTAPKTRGLTRGIGVRQRAKVDLNIPFEVNSSELAVDALKQLRQLIAALSRESLAEYRFQVAGHTDSSGDADYNRSLSERRANAVRQYLIDNGIDPDRLVAVGYGEDMPLNGRDPAHPDNRRVEIANIGAADGN